MVKKLLLLGAEPTIPSSFHYADATALHLATYEGYLEVVNILLEAGVDPNIKNSQGYTAIINAIENKHTAIIRRLLEVTEDLNTRLFAAAALGS